MLSMRYAPWLYRWRWLVLGTAPLFIVLALIYGTGLFAALKTGGFDVPGSESFQAQQLLEKQLPGATPDVILLLKAPGLHPTDPVFEEAARALLRTLQARSEVAGLTSYYTRRSPQLLSDDGRETLVLIQLAHQDESTKEQEYRAILPLLTSPLLQITAGGSVPFAVELNQQVSQDLERAELLTFPLVTLLLLIVFGGLVAAMMPLVIGGMTVILAFAILHLLAEVTEISVFAINVVTMLGLGLSIDYALLMITRFREELVAGDHAGEPRVALALRATLRTAGRAVLFSGLTVSLSLLGLLLFPEVFLRSLGLGAITTVLVALLTALVLLPAFLAVLGKRINLLSLRGGFRLLREGRSAAQGALASRPREEGRGRTTGAWAWIAELVMRHPWPVLLVLLPCLLLPGWPFLSVSFSTPDVSVLPATASARLLAERLSHDFREHGAAQITIALSSETGVLSAVGLARLDRYVQQLKRLPGVIHIESLVTVDPRLSLAEYQRLYAQPEPARQPELTNVAHLLAHGRYTQVTVALAYNELSPQASHLVEQIRQLSLPGGLTALVGGLTAQQIDLFANLRATIPVALALLILAVMLLLFVMTGSLLIPLKTVLLSLLSLTVTFGSLVWIFQQGHLASVLDFEPPGSIDGTQPVLIFAIAFGLSMDYEVFLLSRIKEYYDQSGDNRQAVALGLQRTGGLITSAALLLAVVLAAFATARIIFIKEIGVGLALAVLLDASIIRALLVPATMRLLGDFNWWAPPLLRALWRRMGWSELDQ
ncbi:MMPL family transporter [Thermogemmatispora onikobensis]|uniref:MMPL family transporter n=1 Tax=Thermogemmatispora onikobensis TaxID=732234 RepID=UPI000852A10D|nr:MMPL family transporter [Thermogemmatispora onikobensis]